MLDGSVRFIPNTVDSWAIDPATNLPPGLTLGGSPVLYQIGPGFGGKGVYQKLHTRNGEDIVGSTDY